LLVQHKLSLES